MSVGNALPIIVTAGSSYLDIDAYACCVALKELFLLQGIDAIAYSPADCNYSVPRSMINVASLTPNLPSDIDPKTSHYVIADVSDPDYLDSGVPLQQIVAVYDHHSGFETYWSDKLGENAVIEFVGSAATLVYREWRKSSLQGKIKRSTALMLIAAILDNTLNLLSSNTTKEDVRALDELCKAANVDENWREAYFAEVQQNIESNLKKTIFGDIKHVHSSILPEQVAQICIWNADSIIGKLPKIGELFGDSDDWMINLIDIRQRCSYFVCPNENRREGLESVFGVHFETDVAKASKMYLRKELLKLINEK